MDILDRKVILVAREMEDLIANMNKSIEHHEDNLTRLQSLEQETGIVLKNSPSYNKM
jgi:hypothetical protein